MTRTLLSAFILLSVLLTFSCSKSNNDTPTPTPPVDTTAPVKPDTLITGWTKIKISTEPLYDVFFSNNTIGYSICPVGFLYKTIDGGISWVIKKDSLSDIANMSVTNNGNIHCINTNGYVYTSVNGGSNFSRTRLNTVGNSFDVFFPDDNNGFTVSGGALFQTTDGGINWSGIFQTTGLSLSPTGFYSLFFLNDTTGWICGEGKIFKSNGNLHSWTQSIFPSSTALASLLNVFATSTATVFASSYYSVFESANEGLNFSILSTLPYIPGPQTSPIPDLHFIDASTGYMCLGTRIFKTINGGISWTPVVSLGGSPIIIEIHFTDANHGWGCTSDGYILRYSM